VGKRVFLAAVALVHSCSGTTYSLLQWFCVSYKPNYYSDVIRSSIIDYCYR